MKFKIVLITEGKKRFKFKEVEEMIDEYRKRMGKYGGLDVVFFSPRKKEEALSETVEYFGRGEVYILDEKGVKYSSEELSKKVEVDSRFGGKEIIFVIGDADGFTKKEKTEFPKEKFISLSNMTFHHELAALMMSEQVYRVATIINGHPYHRE